VRGDQPRRACRRSRRHRRHEGQAGVVHGGGGGGWAGRRPVGALRAVHRARGVRLRPVGHAVHVRRGGRDRDVLGRPGRSGRPGAASGVAALFEGVGAGALRAGHGRGDDRPATGADRPSSPGGDATVASGASEGGRAMRGRWLWLFFVGVGVILVGGLAGRAPAAKLAGKSVKLGAIYSITGKGAEWGEHSKIATEIAVDEINKAGGVGGVPLEVILQDTGTEVAPAISLARKLILEDKVLAILGP